MNTYQLYNLFFKSSATFAHRRNHAGYLTGIYGPLTDQERRDVIAGRVNLADYDYDTGYQVDEVLWADGQQWEPTVSVAKNGIGDRPITLECIRHLEAMQTAIFQNIAENGDEDDDGD